MKIKSLLLTGMAALAMFSCSNENDPAIAGNEVAKDAALSFSFTMPNVATRAETDPAGTAQEQNVNNITLELDYTDEGISNIVKNYPVAAFTPSAGGVYTLNTAESVAPGAAKMNIYVNTDGAVAKTVASTSAFDLGNNASTAGTGNFTMSGSSDINIVAKVPNTPDAVPVSRIAAKLEEVSDANGAGEGRVLEYVATAENPRTDAADLKITLLDYTFSNLNKTSNTFALESKLADNFWNIIPIGANTTASWSDFGAAVKPMADQITYCFENGDDAPTTIWYKAQAEFTGYTKGNNFYVYQNEAYATYALLNEKLSGNLEAGFKLTDSSPIADFSAHGIEKFEAGICYYSQIIETNGTTGIDRNNWYKLGVTGIKDLGLYEPKTDLGEPTLLIFSATVQPWTVVNFDYEL